jgi:hypothetical protein
LEARYHEDPRRGLIAIFLSSGVARELNFHPTVQAENPGVGVAAIDGLNLTAEGIVLTRWIRGLLRLYLFGRKSIL